ncbi:MAG: hypothetical protein KJ675_07875 [Gammaproteobacteria bacterium]|nr:hypothetical protein [Gammaproteobacteria bacterium]MBU1961115.1 hypothetical protein [Gammaproteobacteria bacterium]
MTHYIIPLEQLGMGDVETVGGKNASLGEMIRNLAGLGGKESGPYFPFFKNADSDSQYTPYKQHCCATRCDLIDLVVCCATSCS